MSRCDRCGGEITSTRGERLCPACEQQERRRAEEELLAEAEAWRPYRNPAGPAGPGKDGINLHR
mgnify:CR=1 FL=1